MGKILPVLTGVLHVIYPKRCPICDRIVSTSFFSSEYPVCDNCKKEIEYVREPACKKCGKPLTDWRREFCPDCMRHAHLFQQGKALWVHKGEIKKSIYRLKYKNRREYARTYGQEIVKQYEHWIRQRGIQAIIPIPLHAARKRQRGYNQAELIAKEIGRQMNIPVYTQVLKRSLHTKPQKNLDDKERKNNLKKAFKIAENDVKLRHVLLVDDIYTTGSTMDGATGALQRAGISPVYCISVSIGRGY